MSLANIIGWVGAFILLALYFLMTLDYVSNNSKIYKILNLFGALFLVISGVLLKAYPFVAINSIWCIISAISLFKKAK